MHEVKNTNILSRSVGIFCILAAALYYFCLFGRMIFDLGFVAFSRFSYILEGITSVTIVNPIIIVLWYLNALGHQVLPGIKFFAGLAVILAPVFLFIGGTGAIKKKRWAKVILVLYACYWGLTWLSIAIVKVIVSKG